VRSANEEWLKKLGVRQEAVSERDYYPRVLLGAYYKDQLDRMIRTAGPWHKITVETETRVLDVCPEDIGFRLAIENKRGKSLRRFDTVVMATGHLTKPTIPKASSKLFRSPYPVGNLTLD